MSERVSLALVKKCSFALAKAISVTPNPTSRNPSYILSLQLSAALSAEHQSLYKKAKPTYTSSAQITTQHTIKDLDGALMLTLINFPRKQIGRTMSDCLTTGVLPADPGVSDKEKRENTVYVRPFLGQGVTDEKKALLEPGSKIGVLGEEGIIETNPRDLSWAEFATIKYIVGKVLSVGDTPQVSDSTPDKDKVDPAQTVSVPLKVDFGAAEGQKDALVHLRSGFISPQELVGRQILAVVNLEAPQPAAETEENKPAAETEENKDETKTEKETPESPALVLTVGGKTTVEPAKEVPNGYRLA